MARKYWKPIVIIILATLTLGILIARLFTDTVFSGWITAAILVIGWGLALGVTLFKTRSIKAIVVTVFSVYAVAVLLTFPYRYLLPLETFVTITATGEKNEASLSSEVWIVDIAVDGKNLNLSRYLTDGWVRKEGGELVSTEGSVTLKLKQYQNLYIGFVAHPWSGIVEVTSPSGTERDDLYLEAEYTTRFAIYVPFTPISDSIATPWALDFVFVLAAVCALAVAKKFVLSLLRYGIKKITPLPDFMRKYYRVIPCLFLIIISVCLSFCLFGYRLFLYHDLVEANFRTIVMFCILTVAMIPIVFMIIYCLEVRNFRPIVTIENTETNTLKIWILSAGIQALLLVIIASAFYPGNMTGDSTYQWSVAIGTNELYNYHSPLALIIMRLCYMIWPNLFSVIIFQILWFVTIVSSILCFFYKKGMSKKMLIFISFLIPFIPTNYMMLTLVTKNTFFSISVLWATYTIIRLIDNTTLFFRNHFLKLQFLISWSIVCLIRPNALICILPISILLILIFAKYYKQLRIYPLVILCSLLLIIGVTNGPIYNLLGVKRAEASFAHYGPIISPLGAAYKYGATLPKDTLDDMEKILPLTEWYSRYNPYDRDRFGWEVPRPDYSQVQFKTLFKYYFDLLLARPDIVIKDRLDATNIIWNVFDDPKLGTHRGMVGRNDGSNNISDMPELFLEEDLQTNGLYLTDNVLQKPVLSFYIATSKLPLFDALLWRNGLYVIVLLCMILYAVSNKYYKLLLSYLSILCILLTYILTLSWQLYQYIWFFPLSVCTFGGYTILMSRKTKEPSQ